MKNRLKKIPLRFAAWRGSFNSLKICVMKKIRFFQVFNVCVYNVAFSESKILNLIDDFETGRIAAAAARRRFLDLWYNFIIDVQRYNRVLIAWRVYDADSL